nr:excalibur calcium-binding domain-containing protein [Comamonas koreensis]
MESLHSLTSKEGETVFRPVIYLLIALAAWTVYSRYEQQQAASLRDSEPVLSEPEPPEAPEAAAPSAPNPLFKCDGRTHCSQMTSCKEAKLFLKNCPDTKMDGDNDGVPCERQLCNVNKRP